MSSLRPMPMWARHLLAFVVSVALVVAVVVFVQGHNKGSEQAPAKPSKAQQAAELHQEAALVRSQQTPHRALFAPKGHASVDQPAKVRQVVSAYVRKQISQGSIKGPYQSSRCRVVGSALRSTHYSCTVTAGDLNFRFSAAATFELGYTGVTYCQVVTPPYPLRPIPVDSSCR